MKILKGVLIVLLLFSFSGCGKEVVVDPVDPLTCGDNQIEENGVCVIVDQDLEDMKIALAATKELSNYKIEVVVEYSQNTIEYSYEMSLSFDDNLAMFEMEDEKIYYESLETSVNQYTKQGNSYLLESVDQEMGYGFYQMLEASWFTKLNDYYILSNQYLDQVSELIQSDFPEGEVNNFKVGLLNEKLDYFSFDMILGEETYHLTFSFTAFGQVGLVLPVI
ncbi:MAG: hypothetical protein K8Q99_07475 [Acholeplasmataceae bacterium]|nr:hypothetical protein [Acholeplasmataceae bacterium]